MKRIFLIGLALILAFGLSAFAVQKGGTLTIASGQTFKDLNPMISNSAYDFYVINQIYDDLLYTNPETNFPEATGVAKNYEFSEDKCEITFHIQEGITAHNGEVINAEDVAFTFNWIIDPENASPNASELAWLQEVEVVDDLTAKFITKPEKCPYAPALLGESRAVVPKDTFLEMGADKFNRNPVGSGPFKFVEWKSGDHITLVKNENYWLKEPNLDKIIFRPIPKLATMMLELEKGGVDITDTMVAEDIPRFKEMDDVKVLTQNSFSYFYFAFNMSKAPFNDIRFRKAVYQSFSMDNAVQAIFKGLTAVRAYGAVPPPMWANDSEYLKNNVALEEDAEEASRLFRELRKENVLPPNFSPTIYCPPDPRRTKLSTIVATSLKEHGIDTKVQPLEWGAYLDLLYRSGEHPLGEYGMYVIGWSSIADPYGYLYYLFTSENAVVGSGNNFSFYSNPLVDQLILEANTTFDKEVREEKYVKAQRIIFESYVHLPAYHYIENRGTRARVKGYTPDPSASMNICTPYANVWVEQ
jgi:peptide/nickel transport system substrate-binding protein